MEGDGRGRGRRWFHARRRLRERLARRSECIELRHHAGVDTATPRVDRARDLGRDARALSRARAVAAPRCPNRRDRGLGRTAPLGEPTRRGGCECQPARHGCERDLGGPRGGVPCPLVGRRDRGSVHRRGAAPAASASAADDRCARMRRDHCAVRARRAAPASIRVRLLLGRPLQRGREPRVARGAAARGGRTRGARTVPTPERRNYRVVVIWTSRPGSRFTSVRSSVRRRFSAVNVRPG